MNTGTIPSKTIREAILYLTGPQPAVDLRPGLSAEGRDRDRRHLAARAPGGRARAEHHPRPAAPEPRLADRRERRASSIRIRSPSPARTGRSGGSRPSSSCSRPAPSPLIRPRSPSTGRPCSTATTSCCGCEKLPSTIVIVGAGVIGVEFASMFAALGAKVTIVDARPDLLDFCDHEIAESLRYHLRDLNVIFRFGERVIRVEASERGTLTSLGERQAHPGGRRLLLGRAARARRPGSTSTAPASRPTSAAGSRSTSTSAPPSRTSTPSATWSASRAWRRRRPSRAGSRRATRSALETNSSPRSCRSGSTRSPRSATSARTERELTDDAIPYEVGIAHYRELARGQILGESHGV